MIHNTHWGPTSFSADWPTNTQLTPFAAPFPAIAATAVSEGTHWNPAVVLGFGSMHLYRNSLLWKWEDWSKSNSFAGLPEICYWEALKSQELSFSKSKLEHHKSVPSSWALGPAKRQNADFFKDLLFKRDCGAVTEHAFLLFNLFS